MPHEWLPEHEAPPFTALAEILPVVRSDSDLSLIGAVLTGTTIRLEARCGKGGAGIVYLGCDTVTGCLYAVKVLHPGLLSDLLLGEAKILRTIDSKMVVHFHASGVLHDGRPWMAMEYLPGRSLSRVLNECTSIDLHRVIGWLKQMCRGLSEIHAKGWAHRDIKPSNMLLVDGEPERIVIIDLGIAKRIGVQPRDLSGTPDYIAPEQARRALVDPRSDIYSLGCCAYKLMTGQCPVPSTDAQHKVDIHLEGIRLTWPRKPLIPGALRKVVERCLAYQPEDRPRTMKMLELELEEARVEIGRDVLSMPPARRATVCSTTTLYGHPGAAESVVTLVDRDRRGCS